MAVATSSLPARSKVPPHAFYPDEELGWESYVPVAERGRPRRRYCRFCRLPGEPGDARHPAGALPPPFHGPPPDPAAAAAWAAHDRAVTGEREE